MPEPGDGPFIFERAHPSLSVDTEKLRRILGRAAEAEQAGIRSVTVILADHSTVRKLNSEYLSHDYDTDVLAFPLNEGGEDDIEGEIYVDLDTASERHTEFGTTFEEEAFRYALHGLLHLIGYTDDGEDGKKLMHELENRYLNLEEREPGMAGGTAEA